jgi:hypothetical protein
MSVKAPVAHNCGVKAQGENQMKDGGCATLLPPYWMDASMIIAKTTAFFNPV